MSSSFENSTIFELGHSNNELKVISEFELKSIIISQSNTFYHITISKVSKELIHFFDKNIMNVLTDKLKSLQLSTSDSILLKLFYQQSFNQLIEIKVELFNKRINIKSFIQFISENCLSIEIIRINSYQQTTIKCGILSAKTKAAPTFHLRVGNR